MLWKFLTTIVRIDSFVAIWYDCIRFIVGCKNGKIWCTWKTRDKEGERVRGRVSADLYIHLYFWNKVTTLYQNWFLSFACWLEHIHRWHSSSSSTPIHIAMECFLQIERKFRSSHWQCISLHDHCLLCCKIHKMEFLVHPSPCPVELDTKRQETIFLFVWIKYHQILVWLCFVCMCFNCIRTHKKMFSCFCTIHDISIGFMWFNRMNPVFLYDFSYKSNIYIMLGIKLNTIAEL